MGCGFDFCVVSWAWKWGLILGWKNGLVMWASHVCFCSLFFPLYVSPSFHPLVFLGTVTFLLWHPTAYPCDVFLFRLILMDGLLDRWSQAAIFSPVSLRCAVDVPLHSTDGFAFLVLLFSAGFGSCFCFCEKRKPKYTSCVPKSTLP